MRTMILSHWEPEVGHWETHRAVDMVCTLTLKDHVRDVH